MSKPILLLSLFLAAPLFGCSSDSVPQVVLGDLITPTPPPPPPPAADDVSGNWFLRIADNQVNCDLGEIIDAKALVITQDANDITVLTSTGDVFAGTVNGDIVEWTGDADERGGTTTLTSLSLTASAGTASGNAAWTWTDGTDSCNGTMAITASQDWSVTDGGQNSRPGIADALVFTDGVAFVAGTVSQVTDDDYFSFVLATDATVQVELSHFDPLNNDLALEILDENLNQVAFSDSVDGFEKVEVQLLAGVTYTIGMRPVLAPGSTSYLLSVDVN